MAHVADYKKEVVKNMVELFGQFPIVGVLNMEDLPTAQLQKMRGKLREKMTMFMTKKRLMKIAIKEVEKSKPEVGKIVELIEKGMPALFFTKENPFALYKTIKKSKSKAPAKPGQEAPFDIEVKAGPTPFPPGPVISELGALGLKTKVQDGKVTILEDAIVVKEGEKIKDNVASMLMRLSIEPMEIGLDLVGVLENGEVLKRDVLDIDEDKFMADLNNSITWAVNLSVEVGWPTKDTIGLMLGKAYKDSKAVGLEGGIMADALKDEVLAKVEAGANALKEAGNVETGAPKEVKEEEKEEPKVEEKAPEPVKEEVKPEVKEEPKVEAPKEEPKVEEAKPEVKEEPPKEEPKVEEKAPEPVEEEPKPEVKEEPKVEETPKEEPKDESEKQVEKLVKEAREKEKGPDHTAEDLLKEVSEEGVKEAPKEEKAPEPVKEEPKVEEAKPEVKEEPKVEEKAPEPEAPKEEPKVDDPKADREKEEEKKKEDEKRKEVEDLTAELLKKGTLRD
tara:strand:- start:1078 stop:2592 length:1515 start_codon:yes stop_codon:yes gene_type:complete